MKRKLAIQYERFNELIKKESLTMDNILEIEDMILVDKIEQVGDEVIIKVGDEIYTLKFKEEDYV